MDHYKKKLKLLAGHLLEALVPSLRRDLETDRHSGRFVRLKRMILFARSERAKVRGDAHGLQKNLFLFWRAETSESYFDRYLDRYEKWFLGPHHEIVDQLAILSRDGDYSRLVEVGCGAGQVLQHCAVALPEVHDFIGVDINVNIIARNKFSFAQNPRLQFLSADASVWLGENATPGTILLTYGGVMEYFSSETLSVMFRYLAQHRPAAVALVEPVDPDHDLLNDPASHAFGQENSFSHNHERLLMDEGYRTMFRKELRVGGVSWVMLLAATG